MVAGLDPEWFAPTPKSPKGKNPHGNKPDERREKQADQLVRLALELFRLGRTPEGETFAVPKDGPLIASFLRGARDSLRARLAREYRRRFGTTPSASALADALVALEGEALDAQPEEVHLRVARCGETVVLDIGDTLGRAVVIGPNGWRVEPTPVLFRRTELTAAFQEPLAGWDLLALQDLLNVSRETFDLLVAWLIAALIPEVEHPVLLLGGPQGTGKSTAAELIGAMIDPSTAPLQSPPRDPEQWAVTAAAAYAVTLDNLSRIPVWLADALCRAVTGDAFPRRRLYTNSELSVLRFRRAVVLTSIDPGALRGDLADRLVAIDLDHIPEESRRSKVELMTRFRRLQPQLLGAQLDLLAGVLGALPEVRLERASRLMDFERVLEAVDRVRKSHARLAFLRQRGRLAEDVVEGDPVALAVLEFCRRKELWTGTAGELLEAIKPQGQAMGDLSTFPRSPRTLAGHLRRIAPALRELGVEARPPTEESRGPGRSRPRLWSLRLCSSREEADPTVQTDRPADAGPEEEARGVPPRTVESRQPFDRPPDRPERDGSDSLGKADPGRSDDVDDSTRPFSLDGWDEDQEGRAAIPKYDGGLDRGEAERGAGLLSDEGTFEH